MGAPYKKSISRKSPECLLSFFNLNGVYTLKTNVKDRAQSSQSKNMMKNSELKFSE